VREYIETPWMSMKSLVRAMSAQANHLHNAGERDNIAEPKCTSPLLPYRNVTREGIYERSAAMGSINLRHSLGTTRSLNHAQVLEHPPAAYKEVTSPKDSKCLPIATQSSSPTWDATAVRFRIPIYGSARDVASH
jgi:hypothetical protein